MQKSWTRCYTGVTLLIYMPTTKTRINLTVSPSTNDILTALAERDKTSVSAKTLDLLLLALELEEDAGLLQVITDRENGLDMNEGLISHEDAWV